MAYEKQNFKDDQTLEAEHLNHMEEGIAAAHEQSGGGGVTIDLLWENPWYSDEFEAQEISIPNIGDYDIIEIAHRNNETYEATTRIPVGGYGEGHLCFSSAGYGVLVNSRYFGIDAESGIIGFGAGQFWKMLPEEAAEAGENGYACVPFRIYGIKGVNKSIVEGSFTIDSEEFKFIKGWNWRRWCESSYNTIGLTAYTGGVRHEESNSTLALDGTGDGLSADNLIIDGGKYELL